MNIKAFWFALGCALSLAAPPAGAQSPAPIPAIDEIVVEAPGPPLWRAFDSDSEVFILGAVDTLPENMRWNSRPLQTALRRADRLWIERDMSVGLVGVARILIGQRNVFQNPNGATLQQILPAQTLARLQAAAGVLEVPYADLQRLRPSFAGNVLIQETVKAQNLASADMKGDARRLARAARVRVSELDATQVMTMVRGLNDMPLGADIPCLDVQLDAVERQGPLLRQRAQAWARGDVDALRTFSAMVDHAQCFSAIADAGVDFSAMERGRVTAWRDVIQSALRRPGVRVAVIDIDLLLRPQGVVEALQAAGVNVAGEGGS